MGATVGDLVFGSFWACLECGKIVRLWWFNLNVIHVTSTKGKGSTCAFCDSILWVALPDKKIGVYICPP